MEKTNSMAHAMCMAILLLLFSVPALAQNLTEEQTVDYIDKKLKISDPVYSSFTLGENGETVMKWVNNGFYNEYRFNIREIEIELELSQDGDNYISLTCISGVNNCIQKAIREDINKVGDNVSYDYFKELPIKSIAGFDNITSLKNALKYLKIISVRNNSETSSSKKDPFLY